jgi:hypothetical protein
MRATKRQTEAIRAYVEDQAHEAVVHLEKAASELVGPVRHDIWEGCFGTAGHVAVPAIMGWSFVVD